MSFMLLNATWKAQLQPMAKLVLACLADMSNDAGECYPSILMLVERCGMSDRGVQKQIAYLESSGYLHREFRNGRSTLYTVTPERGSPQDRTEFTPAPNDVHPEQDSPPPPNPVHPSPEPHSPSPERGSPLTTTQSSPNHQLNRQRRNSTTERGSRLPDNWAPSTDLLQWAMKEVPGLDIETATAEFGDFWRAIPGARGVKVDWEATWRNGMRRAYRINGPPKHASNKPAIAQQFSQKTYNGTPDDELPGFFRN